MIANTEVRRPQTRQYMSLVAPEEVERFLDRYLPLGLMASEFGMQAKHVAVRAAQKLAKLAIELDSLVI